MIASLPRQRRASLRGLVTSALTNSTFTGMAGSLFMSTPTTCIPSSLSRSVIRLPTRPIPITSGFLIAIAPRLPLHCHSCTLLCEPHCQAAPDPCQAVWSWYLSGLKVYSFERQDTSDRTPLQVVAFRVLTGYTVAPVR